jgi:hypothetical protein
LDGRIIQERVRQERQMEFDGSGIWMKTASVNILMAGETELSKMLQSTDAQVNKHRKQHCKLLE